MKHSVLKGLLSLFLLFFSLGVVWAAASGEEGNAFFAEGDFERAARAYELHLSKEGDSAAGYYNLALAEENLGKVSEAATDFLRAYALDPANAQIQSAMQKFSVANDLDFPEPTWATHMVEIVGNSRLWVLGAGLAWFGATLVLGGILFRQNRAWFIGFGISFILIGKGLLVVAYVGDPLMTLEGVAVIQGTETVEMKANPLDQAKGLARLKPGSAVERLNTRGRWAYCVLSDGRTGWIPTNKLTLILPVENAVALPEKSSEADS
ncbi:MAG: tetratricopeptide repeat protein [Chthoniobacterales bacterium]